MLLTSGMPVLPPQVCAFTLMNYPALAHAQPALFLHQNQESSPRLRSHLVHRETSPDGTACQRVFLPEDAQ